MKKEFSEQLRSGKLTILGLLFLLFGIMSPAFAKMTPWLIEIMSNSLAEGGMTITVSEVTALDSWMQFFKNMPMALIAFVLLESSIFTKEYARGTLIQPLTKGLRRSSVVISKATLLFLLWTIGYGLYFAVTYGYTVYFWDNSVVKNLLPAVGSWWLFGLWTIALTVFCSTVGRTNTAVLAGTGIGVLVAYLLGFLPKVSDWMPTRLTDGSKLIYGLADVADFRLAIAVSLLLTVLFVLVSIPVFNRKQL